MQRSFLCLPTVAVKLPRSVGPSGPAVWPVCLIVGSAASVRACQCSYAGNPLNQ